MASKKVWMEVETHQASFLSIVTPSNPSFCSLAKERLEKENTLHS